MAYRIKKSYVTEGQYEGVITRIEEPTNKRNYFIVTIEVKENNNSCDIVYFVNENWKRSDMFVLYAESVGVVIDEDNVIKWEPLIGNLVLIEVFNKEYNGATKSSFNAIEEFVPETENVVEE